MEGWQAPKERGGSGDGKGPWLKLADDGDLAVVVFLGEPLGRDVVFDGGKYTPFTSAHAEQGIEAKRRYSVNVGVLSTNVQGIKSPEVRVFEMSSGLYRDVFALRNKFGVSDWAYEIKRSGKPKDPQTTYRVLPERQLVANEKTWMASASLTNLRQLYEGQRGDSGRQSSEGEGNRELAQLVGRLDRDGQQRFFERFGVRALSELQPVLVPKAVEFLRDLARAPQSGPAGTGTTTTPARPAQGPLTIGDDLATAIVVDLKKLPQDAVRDWLKHCGIQRVRELPVDRVPDAKAFLALLLKEFGPAPTAPVDPYL
jgi:hypothetical protein